MPKFGTPRSFFPFGAKLWSEEKKNLLMLQSLTPSFGREKNLL